MASLAKLLDCCQQLNSDKITERKKQMEVLLHLLNNADIITEINNNSDQKRNLTWDKVFESIQACVLKEMEYLRVKGVEHSASATVISNCEKRKQECISLIRLVVKKANAKEPRLKTVKLVNHLINVMKSEFYWHCVSKEYSNLLLSDVLGNHAVSRELPPSSINNLIGIYVDMYKSSDSNYELYMQILEKLIHIGAIQTTLNSVLLFQFFEEVIVKFWNRLSPGQQHILMKTCYTFCSAVAYSNRLQICNLGEEIFDVVIASLEKTLPKTSRAVLISILQLQINCHHPQGAISEESGMLAIDKLRWQKSISYLYEVLFDELTMPSMKFRNADGKFVELEPDYLDLLVNVCHLVYSMTNVPGNEEMQYCAKKRRNVPQFFVITEMITSVGVETLDMIQWLQLLSSLLNKYPSVISRDSIEEWCTLVQLLHQLVLDCKSYVIMPHLLTCIRSVFLALQNVFAKESQPNFTESLSSYWNKIYEISLRTVSLNYCIPEGHALIQELIRFRVIQLGSELKCLFSPGIFFVSHHSLLTLAMILKHYKLQHLSYHLRLGSVVSLEKIKCPDPDTEIRIQLLDWLLPNLLNERNAGIFKKNDAPLYTLMGEILISLMLQEHQNILILPDMHLMPSHLQLLEMHYLRSVFSSESTKNLCEVQALYNLPGKQSIILSVKDKCFELLLRDCGYLLDSSIAVEGVDIIAIATQCCLVTKYLGCLIKYELLSVQDLASCPLCGVLQKLIKRMADILYIMCTQETHSPRKMQTLVVFVAVLQQLYSWDGNLKFCKTIMQFCREMTSEKLVDTLFEILYGKIFPEGTSHSLPTNQINASSMCDGFEFSEFKSMATSSANCDTNDDTALHPSSVLDGCSNLLTVPLDDIERLQLDVAHLLVTICQYSRPPLLSPLRPAAASRSTAVNNSCMQTRILEPLLQPSFTLDRPGNVQLAVEVIKKLLEPAQQLNDHHIDLVLSFLRKMCRYHFKDGEVSADCLSILASLCLRLEASSRQNQDKALHILSVFWDFKAKGKCGPSMEQGLANVIAALIKCKPEVYQRDPKNPLGSFTGHASDLAKFLESHEHRIALFAADHITLLFNADCHHENDTLEILASHQRMLDLVKISIKNSAVGLDSSLSSKDHQQNWTTTVLTTLMNIAVVSPFCLKEAVLLMCEHIKEIPLSINIVKRVLKQVSCRLNYPTLASFCTTHMGYIAHHYCDINLGELLWCLTDMTSKEEFYKKYYPIVVPHLFPHLDKASQETLAQLLDLEWKNVVEECFPQIMAFILPALCQHAKECEGKGKAAAAFPFEKSMANKCHHLLTEILSTKVVDELLKSRLSEVVVAILNCLYVQYCNGDMSTILPTPNPPFWESSVIDETLHYLMKTCSNTSTSLIIVLSKSQDGLQSALLSLHVLLESSHEPHEIYRAMSMYALFVRLILKDFHTGLHGGWAFLLQEIISVLAQQLTRFCCVFLHDTALLACGLLMSVIQTVTEICGPELGKHLPMIVNCLLPYLKDGSQCLLVTQIVAILNFVILESGDNLTLAVENLEVFPDWPVLSEIRAKHLHLKYGCHELTLRKALFLFLNVSGNYAKHNRSEELQFLKNLLATKKDELGELIMELENARLSNECKETILYRLVVELVNLCADKSLDFQVVVNAAKCLGEVGPISLHTTVLHASPPNTAYHNALSHFKGKAFGQCCTMIFHKLHSYLIASNVEVKRVATVVLKKLLSTKSGHDFKNLYSTAKVGHLFNYLHPFHCKIKPVSFPISPVTGDEFSNIIDSPSLWLPDDVKYETWIRDLVCVLIDTRASKCEIIQHVRPICEAKVEFCEELIPYLVHIILSENNEVYRTVLTRQINNFFAKFSGQWETITSISTSSVPSSNLLSGSVCCDRKAIEVLLNVVKFLRLQDRPKIKGTVFTSWDNNFWLDLNYLQLAEAANFCQAYLTSLYFLEIWYDVRIMRSNSGLHQFFDSSDSTVSEKQLDSCPSFPNISQIMSISSSFSEEGSRAQDLLLQIYRSIGDPDAIYGCGTTHLTNPSNRLHFYEHEHQWEKALSACDFALYSEVPVSQEGMLKAMFKMGLHHLLKRYNATIINEATEQAISLKEYQYECAWKMSQWSLPTASRNEVKASFHSSIFELLYALSKNDENRFWYASNQAYSTIIEKLRVGNLESAESLYSSLAHLSSLNHHEEYLKIKVRQENNLLLNVLKVWEHEHNLFQQNYDLLEPIISLRVAVLQLLYDANQQDCSIRNALVTCLEQQVKLSREHGLFQWSNMYIMRLRQIAGITSEKKLTWKIEEAENFWLHSEQETAKSLLCSLIHEINQKPNLKHSKVHAQALGLYGDWLGKSRSANALVVLENYLEKSISMMEKIHSSENDTFLVNTYLAAARYADSQYQRATNYVKSPEYQSKKEMIERSNDAITKLRSINPKEMTKDKKKTLIMLERQVVIDKEEIDSTQKNKHKFLKQALKHYVNCLCIGDGHNNRVFRLISLWFDNSDNAEISNFIKDALLSIPSHKFLPLIYQLAARMSTKVQSSIFHSTLVQFIIRLIKDHPYHTLHVIFGLSNACKDEQYLSPVRKSPVKKSDVKEEDRVLAARNVLEQLKLNEHLGLIILDMTKVCDAVIELSYWSPPASKAGSENKFQTSLQITHLKNLERIPPLTMSIPVDPSCKYDNLPGIQLFKQNFKICGGASAPKQICCVSTHGKEYVELVKGLDDLRQDAVMQQVFAMVNYLLNHNPDTHRRKLHIRTYKIVPMSQRSGVLEWCANTKPLSEYLVGARSVNEGAHRRVYPNDFTVAECRKLMMQHSGASFDKKFEVYKEICENLKPVFRHFFMECFPDPPTWFEKRTSYIKSVATTSIVGYILGLGDRHVSNILIDLKTGEFIHIDLGVAFDQGKLLPTPETVPFRLTRDVVDGMGIMGTEGIFRRCCEKTMEVMHDSHEVIVTILEVLLYDPLYSWTLTPLKACKLQNRRDYIDKSNIASMRGLVNPNDTLQLEDQTEAKGDVNKQAERVLLRLQEKLQGKEEGTLLSIHGQVTHLLQEAMDPKNLCRLYHGWQPYL